MSSNQGHLVLTDATIKRLNSIAGLTIDPRNIETDKGIDGITSAIQSSLDQPRLYTHEIVQKLCLHIKFNGKEIIIPMSSNGLAYLLSIGLSIEKAREVLAECQSTYSTTNADIFTVFFKTNMQQYATVLEEGDKLPETIEISKSDFSPDFAKEVEDLYSAAYQDHSYMDDYLALAENTEKSFCDLQSFDYIIERLERGKKTVKMLNITINHLLDTGNVDEIFRT